MVQVNLYVSGCGQCHKHYGSNTSVLLLFDISYQETKAQKEGGLSSVLLLVPAIIE